MIMAATIRHTLKGDGGSVDILITEEQARRPGFVEHGSQYHLGFLPHDMVPSYYCTSCGIYYGHPPVIEVEIMRRGSTGTAHVEYRCRSCNEMLHHEPLETPDGIDPEYIVFDGTGRWKPPTEKQIKDMISEARKLAKEGEGNSLIDGGCYRYSLEQALVWAKASGYGIPDGLLGELEMTYRDSYLKRFAAGLPGLIREIKEHSYGFIPGEADGMSHMEASGLGELLDLLYEALPHVELPDDAGLNQDILRILHTDMNMSRNSIEDMKQMIAEIQKEMDAETRNMQRAAERANNFTERSGLTEEQAEEAKRTPLSTYPGDYDDE
jgi:hypothetical protein